MSSRSYVNDDSLFDRSSQLAVIQMIVAGSPKMATEAAKGLGSPNGAGRQLRIDLVVPRALADPAATWTGEQRQQLVMAMGTPPEAEGDMWTPPDHLRTPTTAPARR